MKINSENIDILRIEYCDKKKSINDISKNSENIFGFYVSKDTLCRSMRKFGLNMRDIRESISIGKSTLDVRESYLTESIIEWIDGLMLGDGSIWFNKRRIKDGKVYGAKISIGSTNKSWTDFAMSGLNVYKPCNYYKVNNKNSFSSNPCFIT